MENIEKQLKQKEMINLMYESQEETIDKILKKANKEVKDELKTINTQRAIEDSNNPKELKEIFNKIENNYSIKISKYNKELYKQGFIDGVNLILNCIEK